MNILEIVLLNHSIMSTLVLLSLMVGISVRANFSRNQNWKKVQQTIMNGPAGQNSKEAGVMNNTEIYLTKVMRTLPFSIQEYLKQALFLIADDDKGADYIMHKPISVVESLQVEQEGEFFVKGRWMPFRGTAYISASLANPGFIWDGEVSMYPNQPILRSLKLYVHDYYSNGKGGVEVDMMGIIPVVRSRSDHTANSAQLIRWFSEIVLHPTSFLPHGGNVIHWKQDSGPLEGPWPVIKDPRIRGMIVDPNSEEEVEVEFYFDKKGLVSVVRAIRYMEQNGKARMTPWEGRLDNYQLIDGMTIPLSMEAGWWSEDGKKLDVYFKGRNLRFNYRYY